MIQRTIVVMLQQLDLIPAARRHMADGGPWLMSLGGGCALVFEADARWKTTMEGKQGNPHSFPVEFVPKMGPSPLRVGINNALLSSPHA